MKILSDSRHNVCISMEDMLEVKAQTKNTCSGAKKNAALDCIFVMSTCSTCRRRIKPILTFGLFLEFIRLENFDL